jgi:hypothetical protein
MAIGPDDIRFQGKTGSGRPTSKRRLYRRSPLRHLGQAHPLHDTLTPDKKRRIVGKPNILQATDGESWVKRKSLSSSSMRLIHLPEKREGSGAKDVRYMIIWVGLQTSTRPLSCFGIGSEVQFG